MSSAKLKDIVRMMRDMGETTFVADCDGTPVVIELRPAPVPQPVTPAPSCVPIFRFLHRLRCIADRQNAHLN